MDSTIVLAWTRKPPFSMSTFVTHRITKIIEKVGNKNWQHVDPATNPTDLANRGLLASEFFKNNLWWKGSTCLEGDSSELPKQGILCNSIEEKKRVHVHAITTLNKFDILHRFSILPRTSRVLSHVMRFFQRTHPKPESFLKAQSFLFSNDEIKATTFCLI